MTKPVKKNDKAQELELTEALRRERADFINFRRRSEEDRGRLVNMVKQDVVLAVLPLLDNIRLAMNHLPDRLQNDDWAKGVAQVAAQADSVLSGLGVERIKTVGEEFDPAVHEAIEMEDEGGEQAIITEELAPGWKLGETVLRAAMVKVNKQRKEQ